MTRSNLQEKEGKNQFEILINTVALVGSNSNSNPEIGISCIATVQSMIEKVHFGE
jgi:hypothetical protein